MRFQIYNLFVILALIFSVQCNKETISSLEEIKSQFLQKDFAGQEIVDAIQIQLASGGSADAVVQLLNQLSDDLNKSQQQADNQYAVKNSYWKTQIAGYEKVIDQTNSQIINLNKDISTTLSNIYQIDKKIATTEVNIGNAQKKKSELDNARNVDVAAYNKRTDRQKEILKGVQYLINALNLELKKGKFIQLSDIKQKLHSLAQENPIQALVELSMTFDLKSVQYVLSKLQTIAATIIASLKDDNDHEKDAKIQFKTLSYQINSLLVDFNITLVKAQSDLQQQKTLLLQQQKSLNLAKQQLQNYKNLKTQAINDRDRYNKQYAADNIVRSQELKTVNEVSDIMKKVQH